MSGKQRPSRRNFASTRGVIGRVWMACLTASIRMRLFAVAGVMVNVGAKLVRVVIELGPSHH